MSLSVVLLFGLPFFFGIYSDPTRTPCSQKWANAPNTSWNRRYFIPIQARSGQLAKSLSDLLLEIVGTAGGVEVTMSLSESKMKCINAQKINVTFTNTTTDDLSYTILGGKGYCNSTQLSWTEPFNMSLIEFNQDSSMGFVKKCVDYEHVNVILLVDCAHKWDLESGPQAPIDWTAEAQKSFPEDKEMFTGFKPVPWDAKQVLHRIKNTMEYVLGKSHISTCGYLR